MRILLPIAFASLMTLVVPTAAMSQENVIPFQGYVLVEDQPLNAAAAHLVFRIYPQAEGGEALWTEEHLSVPVQHGVFSVLLGGTVPIADLPFETPLWISVGMAEGPELLPRTRLGTVPSSLVTYRLQAPAFLGAAPEGDVAVLTVEKHEEGPGWGDGIDVIVGDVQGSSWDPNNMTSDGIDVGFSDGNGVRLGYSGGHALFSEFSVESALVVQQVGFPTSSDTSALHNGLEIHGTEGSGIFVGHADVSGVFVNSTTDYGFGVANAGTQGLLIGSTGDDGILIENSGDDALYVGHAGRNGVYVDQAGAGGLHIREATNNGVYIDSTGFSGIHVRKATSHGYAVTEAGEHGLFVQSAGIDGVHVDSAVGWAGYFNGDVKSQGALWADTYENNSDRRLKRDIHPISHGIDDVLRLRPVEFKWRQRSDEDLRLGLIAQEVLEVVPEVVAMPDSKSPYYGVSYSELVPVLIRAIQDQQAAIEFLQIQQKQLQAALGDLSAYLDLTTRIDH